MIKAIDTIYNGYKFRSRLEARWAVFFDALGLKFEYEPEGFQIDNSIYYLPDFRVTSPQGMITWYEIKPESNGESEKMKAFQKAYLARTPEVENALPESFVTLCGDPYTLLIENPQKHVCPRCGSLSAAFYGEYDNGNTYWDCWPCDLDTPGGQSPPQNGLLGVITPHKGVLYADDSETEMMRGRVYLSAVKARQARFEHGANGLTNY